jgi:hypothetical protein
MTTAEHREPCHSSGSRTVLGAPGGEIPPGDSTVCFRYAGMNRHRANFGHRCGDLGRWKQFSYKNINCENGAAMSAISRVRHPRPSFAVIWQCTAHWSRKVRPLPLTGLEKLCADDVTSWPPSSNNRRRLSLSRRRIERYLVGHLADCVPRRSSPRPGALEEAEPHEINSKRGPRQGSARNKR